MRVFRRGFVQEDDTLGSQIAHGDVDGRRLEYADRGSAVGVLVRGGRVGTPENLELRATQVEDKLALRLVLELEAK